MPSYEELHSLLQKGVEWLIDIVNQTIDQIGARNIALAIMALCNFDYNSHKTQIETWREKLIILQKGDGSWHNELWDTSLALMALSIERFCSGKKGINFEAKPFRAGLDFFENRKIEKRSNWEGELYESILTALALLKMEYRREYPFLRRAVSWIISKQSRQGCWMDIYDTALALSLLIEAQRKFEGGYSLYINRALNWLKKWNPKDENCWRNANLLSALLDANMDPRDPTVIRLYKWFYENESEGAWSRYEDEQALALIALSKLRDRLPGEISKVRMVSTRVPKYDIDRLPGTLDNRVFVGGNYDYMPWLRLIRDIVKKCGFQPIFAWDFNVPYDQIHREDLRLLNNCRYAIFEETDPAGDLMEIERARDLEVRLLILFSIRDINSPEPPPRLTSMLTTMKYPHMELRGYSSLDELKKIITDWLGNLRQHR